MTYCEVCDSPRYVPGTRCLCCRSNDLYEHNDGKSFREVTTRCKRCRAKTWLPTYSPICKVCLIETNLRVCTSCHVLKVRETDFAPKQSLCRTCRTIKEGKTYMGNVYILIDPRSEEIRYVGITIQDPQLRALQHLHLTPKDQSYRSKWIKKLKRLGLKPRLEVVQVLPIKYLSEAEVFWVHHFRERGCPLVNGTAEGYGYHPRTMAPWSPFVFPPTRAELLAQETDRLLEEGCQRAQKEKKLRTAVNLHLGRILQRIPDRHQGIFRFLDVPADLKGTVFTQVASEAGVSIEDVERAYEGNL